MKKSAVLLVAAAIVLGSMTAAKASYVSLNQQCNFTYSASSYFAFIYDYSASFQESATPGFISANTSLSFVAQLYAAPTITTHVAYIYNSNVGRYTEAMAYLDQNL